jgi:hypothetical protein
MKKKHPALTTIGADPYGSFMSSLPKTAIVLGFKACRSLDNKSISILYSVDGKSYFASCSFGMKGGES